MKKLITLILLAVLMSHLSFSQHPYKILFYNVENFFDTIDDPEVLDDEFTPKGSKAWNETKYQKKLHNIERVLFDVAAMDKDYPVVMGFCEVENRNVLEDIVSTPKLTPANYRIVHYDSPEARGVDVAFIYRPDIFKKEGEKAVRTIVPSLPDFRTRDILTMWGQIENEPFFFMVAHWPSRTSGKESSEFKRMAVARQMRSIADSVLVANPATKIVMMGDLNDDPTDKSIAQCFGAKFKLKNLSAGDFFNPFAEMLKAGYGSLAYGDAWNIFDQMIVSENLATGSTGKLKLKPYPSDSKFYGNIFKRHYMVQKEGQYKGYPLRTYVGDSFQNGFSDHFPVFITIGK